MLLLHRLTSFFLLVVIGLGLTGVFFFPEQVFFFLVGMIVLSGLLFARLLLWEYKTSLFWIFLGIPLLFIFASFVFFLFLETFLVKILVLFFLLFLLFLFAEYVFLYKHIPTTYRPYAIEYLVVVLNLLSFFYLFTIGYGLRLFLQTPLFVLVILCLPVVFFLLFSTYWVAKVEWVRAKPYVIGGTILFSEVFAASIFLPTSLYTNAAMISVLFYSFLGITRGQFAKKLTAQVSRRYLLVTVLFLLLLIFTTSWM